MENIQSSYTFETTDKIIKITIHKLFDRATHAKEGDEQVKEVLNKVFSFLDSNKEKSYSILGHLEQDDFHNDLGDTKEYLEKLFHHPQIHKIAMVLTNDGAINLMNILGSLIYKDDDKDKVRFFSDIEFAERWLSA